MKDYTHTLREGLTNLAEEARALIDATAHSAEERIVKSRKRLMSALDEGHDVYDRMRGRMAKSARAADETLHENPYLNIAIAFGLGALAVFFLTRRVR